MPNSKKIIVALDATDKDEAISLLDQLDPNLCYVKVNIMLHTAFPDIVQIIHDKGFQLFLDLKFHDIPNTVAGAVCAAMNHGVWMLNVHALGGYDMMVAAKQATLQVPEEQRPILIAVTILTCHDQEQISTMGINKPVEQAAIDLAQLAKSAGLDGVVCSAHEADKIKEACGEDFVLVTPGIRLATAEVSNDDQSRVMTPSQAIEAGANYLVIGRPISQSANPAEQLRDICECI